MHRPSELQIYYQRNLLWGLLSSLVLSILAGLWIREIGGSNSQSLSPGHVAGFVAADTDRTGTTDNENQRYYRPLNPYFTNHEGFLGFIRLQPTGQVFTVPDATLSDILIEEPDLDFSLKEPPELPTSSSHAGGVALSSGDYYDLGTYSKRPNRLLANRDVEVIRRLDPEYPFVARDAGKEGQITVLVYIDSTGELAAFPDWIAGEGIKTLEYTVNGEGKAFQYAIKEEPTDWFFADNLLKVLPKWTFTPKIESGISVSSLLRIKFNFCLGVNCLRLELEQVQS